MENIWKIYSIGDTDELGTALESESEYRSTDWFLSLLGYQELWMSKGSGAICYSNVMRLLCHANILLPLKQRYWSSQKEDESPFQSGWQPKFSSTVWRIKHWEIQRQKGLKLRGKKNVVFLFFYFNIYDMSHIITVQTKI